jgi:hypothetical protein
VPPAPPLPFSRRTDLTDPLLRGGSALVSHLPSGAQALVRPGQVPSDDSVHVHHEMDEAEEEDPEVR